MTKRQAQLLEEIRVVLGGAKRDDDEVVMKRRRSEYESWLRDMMYRIGMGEYPSIGQDWHPR